MNHPASYHANIRDIITRLKRIEGQIRGLQRMVSEEKYCIDILTQVSSVLRATEKVALVILKDHINGCVQDSVHHQGDENRIDELIEVVERFLRS